MPGAVFNCYFYLLELLFGVHLVFIMNTPFFKLGRSIGPQGAFLFCFMAAGGATAINKIYFLPFGGTGKKRLDHAIVSSSRYIRFLSCQPLRRDGRFMGSFRSAVSFLFKTV